MKKKVRVPFEINVGMTGEIKAMLELATGAAATSPSQYVREATLQRLMREGWAQTYQQMLINNSVGVNK